MNLFFSDRPGSHERRLRRIVNNPLFGDQVITQDAILEARSRDETEHEQFMTEFHDIAREASGLDSKADAEVLIDLKSRLEKNYETSSYVMGNTLEIRQALARLIDSIMKALLHASQQDEHAHRKLLEEHSARSLHFELLSHPLIADLVRSDSPIRSEELIPSLLNEQENVVNASVQLFTDDQLAFICEHGAGLLEGVDSDHPRINHARKMLRVLEQARDAAGTVADPGAGRGGLVS